MRKMTYEKVALFAALICASVSLMLHMQRPEPKVYSDVDVMAIVEDVIDNTSHNVVQIAYDTYQKLEDRRIAEEEAAKAEEAARIAAEEDAARKAAEEGAIAEQEEENKTTNQTTSINIDLRSAGVVNWRGYTFTWYSQSILPGSGLEIPGRHVNGSGFVCDGDGFIVAATAFGYGTTGNSPWGAWKSYDTGVSGNIVDLYTNW